MPLIGRRLFRVEDKPAIAQIYIDKHTIIIHKFFSFLFVLFFFCFSPSFAKAGVSNFQNDTWAVLGRWDIEVNNSGKTFPSWLEIIHSGVHELVGEFVGRGGSARPISHVNFNNGKISFSIPPQWE